MAAPVVQKDNLTQHQLALHKYLQIASPVNAIFNGTDLDTGMFANTRVIEVPDIVVDDYIVDSDISRIGADHYSGSQYTSKWKNGVPPIEWRRYSMSRHRSFGYTVFTEHEQFSPIKNLPQEYLARKMSTTVIRDHDKYLLLAIVLGRMTGKLVARTSADTYTSVYEDTTGKTVAEISCTGNQADYKWVSQPGESYDNEIEPSFATIQGMALDNKDPLKTLDALTTLFQENWWDSNYSNNERFILITTSLEISFRDALISKGTYVEGGWDMYKNADTSGVMGPAFFGSLRGWNFLKIHPEFLPKVFVDSNYVVDPNPTLTGVGTAANRTLKQVVGIAAYKGSAQTHDYFADKRSEDGGTRFKGTDYVQDFSYDAWVIDQKSEGIIPLFLPAESGEGYFDYSNVNTSFTNVAAALAAARANGGTAGNGSTYPFYPATGADVNPSTPGWFNQPYTDTHNLDPSKPAATGDISHTHPTSPDTEPGINAQLNAIVDAIAAVAEPWADEDPVTLGELRRFSNGMLFKATAGGTTGTVEPDVDDVAIGDSVEDDGTVDWVRLF